MSLDYGLMIAGSISPLDDVFDSSGIAGVLGGEEGISCIGTLMRQKMVSSLSSCPRHRGIGNSIGDGRCGLVVAVVDGCSCYQQVQ